MGIQIDLSGKVFGRLTVIKDTGKRARRQTVWECKCECGNIANVPMYDLKNGNTKSCGCLAMEVRKSIHLKHGKSKRNGLRASEYSAWSGAKNRCFNKNDTAYKYYGGRGISMSKEWADSFECFLFDMGDKPSPSHSLDRILVNGNYEKGNCRWATKKQQANNCRDNKVIFYKGIAKTLSEWRDELGFSYGAVQYRIAKGWEIEKAFETPVLTYKK